MFLHTQQLKYRPTCEITALFKVRDYFLPLRNCMHPLKMHYRKCNRECFVHRSWEGSPLLLLVKCLISAHGGGFCLQDKSRVPLIYNHIHSVRNGKPVGSWGKKQQESWPNTTCLFWQIIEWSTTSQWWCKTKFLNEWPWNEEQKAASWLKIRLFVEQWKVFSPCAIMWLTVDILKYKQNFIISQVSYKWIMTMYDYTSLSYKYTLQHRTFYCLLEKYDSKYDLFR